jgi:Ni,Fe-hydrogenase maturation factor
LLDARRLLSPGAPWPEIAIMGVEPADLEYGMELSAPVAAALTRVVATARQMVSDWSDADSRKPEAQVPR